MPESMLRAMAKQAEAERERRSKIIHAEGEYNAAGKLVEAAALMATQPMTLQLRYLQTLTEIGVEKNTTIVFPLPMELMNLLNRTFQHEGTPAAAPVNTVPMPPTAPPTPASTPPQPARWRTATHEHPAHRTRASPRSTKTCPDATTLSQDREISLNTSTILLIFFALALVCSAFFGFGYTMGRKTAPPSTYAASDDHTQGLPGAFKAFKPAPGGPAAAKAGTTSIPSEVPEESNSSTSVVVPTSTAKVTPPPAPKKPFDPDAEIVTDVPSPKAVTPLRTTPAVAAPAAAVSTGTVIVQVVALSHQEDADTMVAALKRKGYSVSIHQEPQDRLLHLQLGPYASKKDAEAMRTRLLADGYNSILK